MAKVTDKTEEVTSVTLTLTVPEARALRALTGRCSLAAVGDIYPHTAAVYGALGKAGVTSAGIGDRFRIVTAPQPGATASGGECWFGDAGCDCKTSRKL